MSRPLIAAFMILLGVSGLARAATTATPACFGAAARDALHPCENPRLRYAARPGSQVALLTPSYPCTPLETVGNGADRADGALSPCAFGAPAETAKRTVALIGDSHAMAWRAAVASAVQVLGWHAIDMTRSHCAFSAAVKDLGPAEVTGCRAFNRRVVDWLALHPEVTAAFVAHQTGGTPIITPRGGDVFETEVRGVLSAWRTLPGSVTRVFAIRDNPAMHNSGRTAACIRQARRRRRAPGPFCALPRRQALRDDPFVSAVSRLRSGRFRLADVIRFMCSRTRCLPVIGGALVYKDGTHLTRSFATSLGPFLARRVAEILGR